MNLGEVLQRRCGASASWEEACAVMGAACGLDRPISEAALRMVCEIGDPSFAAYFDRQRALARAVKREAAPEDEDPYANEDLREDAA